MNTKNLSRREFLRVSALTAAGLVAAQCGAPATPAPPAATEAAKPAATEAPKVTEAAPAAKEVTLDVMTPAAEYAGPYREIWNVFEASNPGIKINLISINEDTAAAHEAKVAGGYLPAIENTQEMQIFFNKTNYEMAVDLSSFDFKWWDNWTFPAKTAWSDLFKLPGPRSLDVFQGFVITWQYNGDLMDKAKLDPYRDVKLDTWEAVLDWLDKGAKWAKEQPDVDYFWNQSWHNGVFGLHYNELIPMAFADGTMANQVECFLGKKKFNAEDSPFRHFYQFFKDANDKGWMPEQMWTRQWEGDMEASYIAGKSVMMLHGPWVWDKALAAGSTFKQAGWPATPPAAGNSTWLQRAQAPNIDNQYFIRTGNEKAATWPQLQTTWNWYWSPEAIPMRCQAEGRVPLYKLDKPIDIKGPQYQALVKEIATPGGKFEQVKWEQGMNGTQAAGPYMKKGAKGAWDWQSNGNNELFKNLLTGQITVQQALDTTQKLWEESYEGLPA